MRSNMSQEEIIPNVSNAEDDDEKNVKKKKLIKNEKWLYYNKYQVQYPYCKEEIRVRIWRWLLRLQLYNQFQLQF